MIFGHITYSQHSSTAAQHHSSKAAHQHNTTPDSSTAASHMHTAAQMIVTWSVLPRAIAIATARSFLLSAFLSGAVPAIAHAITFRTSVVRCIAARPHQTGAPADRYPRQDLVRSPSAPVHPCAHLPPSGSALRPTFISTRLARRKVGDQQAARAQIRMIMPTLTS
jgi:hypothetical protein